jgi:hypothetical protein
LGEVIDSLVSKNQSTFIKGRLLLDSVLVVNEVVDFAKKTKITVEFIKSILVRFMTRLIEVFWIICFGGLVFATSGGIE